MPYIADAEIVLEAEVLPTGWTWPEGRFGEFTRLMGGLHWNPLVRIKAIAMRKDAIYYNLHMPWENTWLAAPTRYAAIRQALRTAGVQVKDINVTLGGCAFWHAVISIKKQPGEGKNALLAALSVMDLKHVVVVDDDIDVNDPGDVEWAIATRVQGDRDVMIVSNARAKPLDPSLPQGYGVVPTGAKVGIDATIPEGIPHEHYERITYAYAGSAKIDDYVKGKKDAAGASGDEKAIAALAQQISRRDRQGAAVLHRRRGKIRKFRFQHGGARHRPPAHDGEALAGSARPAVRARLGLCRYPAEAIALELAMLKIFDLNACATAPMENGRGETIRLINSGTGTEKIDLHLNRLAPSGPRGKLHRHSQSDNVYIVRRGEGMLTADGASYTIRTDQVIFIPAGMPHSLSNLSDEVLEIFEIYAPAGRQFDFTVVE